MSPPDQSTVSPVRDPESTCDPQGVVSDRSRRKIRAYENSRDDWNQARILKRLLEQTQREYEDRFLYELIQNGYDAHPTESSDGEICVLLDTDEGDHGVLYVANRGRPFDSSNFEAICELAQSDKDPQESIGNKGVGFKSVLRACQWPEIFSASGSGAASGDFQGYRFTFARPSDVLELVGGDEARAARIVQDVSPYFLPVPLDQQPARVRDFARAGMATVIRLPLRNAEALAVTTDRLGRLASAQVPVHLFLERVEVVRLVQLGDGTTSETRLTRDAITIDAPAPRANHLYELVNLGEQGEWFISRQTIPGSTVREAILASIESEQVDPAWATWTSDATVGVAVRLDGSEFEPRLYTYLPMDELARAPLQGHLHAPFSTKLARTAVDDDVPYNRLLMEAAAEAAVHAIIDFSDRPDVVPASALVDLLAWQTPYHAAIAGGFVAADQEIDEARVLPIVATPDGRDRGSLNEAFAWDDEGLAIVTRERLASFAGAAVVSPEISSGRLERLDAFHWEVVHAPLQPDGDTRAAWLESVAAEMLRRRHQHGMWERFYDDLAQVMSEDPDALRGRAVLLGTDEALHAPPERADGADDSGAPRPLVFFPPARTRTDSDEDIDAAVEVRVPRTLRKTLIEMHEQLRWTKPIGGRSTHTIARRFLEDKRLVRGYKAADLLEHLGRVLDDKPSEARARDALRFAFQIQRAARATRPVGEQDLRNAHLQVPTQGGWIRADRAVFGKGWDTRLGPVLDELVDSPSASADLVALGRRRLLRPGEGPFGSSDDVTALLSFLLQIGVRDGLCPELSLATHEVQGRELYAPEAVARRLGLTPAEADAWATRVREGEHWTPNHERTTYRPRNLRGPLPGLRDHEGLDHKAKLAFANLVLAGAGDWGPNGLRLGWYRLKRQHEPDAPVWPSPLAVALEETPWLPVRDPLDPRTEVFVSPRNAWHFTDTRGDGLPTFSPLVTAESRRLIDSSAPAEAALKGVGLKHWQDHGHALALLEHLATIVDEGRGVDAAHAVRGACVDAWTRLCDGGVPETVPDRLVVTRGGVLGTWSEHNREPVFVGSLESPLVHGLVEASGAALLVADSGDGARIAEALEPHLQLVRRLESVDVVLHADGDAIIADVDAGESLLYDLHPWMREVIALVLETRRSRFDRTGQQRRQRILEQLERVRVRRVGTLAVVIDEEPVDIPARLRGVLPMPDDLAPTLVVPADHDSLAPSNLTHSLCELLGIVNASEALQNVFLKLERDDIAEPDVEDLARALDLDVARVLEIQTHLGSSAGEHASLLAPAVVVLASLEQGQAIWDARDTFVTEPDLSAALVSAVPEKLAIRMIEVVKRAPLLPSIRDSLEIDFGAFNDALRALGQPPIHNGPEHEHATRRFVSNRREEIQRELRLRWLSAYRTLGDLSRYVAARTLSGITPDPDWLDRHAVPTDALLEERTRQWLESEGGAAPLPGAILGAIDDTRRDNHATLAHVTSRAGPIVRCWARKHAAPLHAVWSGDSAAKVADMARDNGLLDFDLFDEGGALACLDRLGLLPESMPRTLDHSALGITEADLAEQEGDVERAKQERRRQERVLMVDGEEVSAEEGAYTALFERLRADIGPAVLGRSKIATRLSLLETRSTRKSRGRERRPGGRNLRSPERFSAIQKAAIGLAGEAVVYEWLAHHYPNEFSPECWRSSYCAVLGVPDGDDSLGYDFEVVLATKTTFFEVKATSGDDTQFELGESEASRARDCAGSSRLDYRVLFVSHVLDTSRRSLDPLPNPMDPKNRDLYRFPGSGLRCVFEPS